MKHVRETYTTLAAAVALACGAEAFAQDGINDGDIRSANPAYERALQERQEALEAGEEILEERAQARDEALERRTEAREEALEQHAEAREDALDERHEAAEQVTDTLEVVERRDELARMADETIDQLRREEHSAAELLEQAHGYAVFDTTKAGLIVTGAGGTGVAREPSTGQETYMHVGAAGVGVGAGVENYKMVLLFEDQQAYDAFVSGQWDGSVSAQAAAREEGAAAEEQFVDGIKVFRLTDTGLIAQVDVSGLRFWPSDRLNDV